jgi:uncharacterized protein (DUF1501 family)
LTQLEHLMQRRHWLKGAALSSAASWLSVGPAAWAAQTGSGTNAAAAMPRLVVVMLRGAVDGLNVVVPYGDPAYYQARSSTALAPPGRDGGVLDLDGHFGLHPALASLSPFWQSRQLGFVQACGSPDPTRSHFDAQDYLESATPGRKATPDGWLNRLLGQLPASAAERGAPTRAVSIGPVLPRIYAGSQEVANIPAGRNAGQATLLDRAPVSAAFAQLYGGDDKLSKAYQASQQAHLEVRTAMTAPDDSPQSREMMAANNGAPLPNGFPEDAARLAQLMRRDGRVQLAFMALGGWDTHARQGGATGQLANHLQPLGEGLAALATGLGPMLDQTVILVMSEFGRTAHENGNGGTDHGHGNVMWLLGGPVAGGKVHGSWPGLGPGQLNEGRDLAVTTDFRQVLAELCQSHLGLGNAQATRVLPGFDLQTGKRLGIVRA